MQGYLPDEVAHLINFGTLPARALRAVTTGATRAVRSTDAGHLSPELHADMVIVEDRPRENSEATADPIAVAKGGELVG